MAQRRIRSGRLLHADPYTTIATVDYQNTYYLDAGLTAGTTYYYVVSANNPVGESADSAEAAATADNQLYGAVIGTDGSWDNRGCHKYCVFDGALANYFDNEISVIWAGLDLGEGVSAVITQIKYYPRKAFADQMVGGVFQGSNTADFSSGVVDLFTISTAPPQGAWTTQSISHGEAFRYVRYLGPSGGVAEVQFFGDVSGLSGPSAPDNLASTTDYELQIDLTWNVVAGADSYNVKRATVDGGPYTILENVTGAASYSDDEVTTGTTYYYVVSAVNSAGQSINSLQIASSPKNNIALNCTASASSENSYEPASNAFDGSTSTKWFNDNGGSTGWLQVDLGSGNEAAIVRYDISSANDVEGRDPKNWQLLGSNDGSTWATLDTRSGEQFDYRYQTNSYSISSANDVPGRDPKNWQLLGSNDGSTWTTLDTRTGEQFAERYQTNQYSVTSSTAYRYYRLNITANNGDSTSIQLSELALISVDGSQGAQPASNAFDGSTSTKWYNDNSSPTGWLQYDFGDGNVWTVVRYDLSSANDEPRRDPRAWQFLGSHDGVNWTVLDTRPDETFATRGLTKQYGIVNSTAYRYYRLNITANNGDSAGLQLSEMGLMTYGDMPPVFTSDPIVNLDGIELSDYTGTSLVTYADDLQGIETVTFSKDSGPDWLTVASDGTLSGIPRDRNVGENTFTVRVTDVGGLYDTATMTIDVANTYSGIQGMDDLIGLAAQWLSLDCIDIPPCGGASLDGNDDVTLTDFSVLSYNWLADESLQLHLQLDETSGLISYDNSIYTRHGDLVNGPVWSSGHDGGSLDFDGVDDYVRIAGYKGITGMTGRTCAFWIKTTSTSVDILGWGRLFDANQQYVSGQKYQIVFYNEEVGALVQGGNAFCAAPEVNDDQWHHVAVVLDDANDDGILNVNETQFYIDGSACAISRTAPLEVNTAAYNDVHLGMYPEGDTYWLDGSLDDLRIYDRALTEQEILNLTQ